MKFSQQIRSVGKKRVAGALLVSLKPMVLKERKTYCQKKEL